MKMQNILTRLKLLIVLTAIVPTLIITMLVFFIGRETITQALTSVGAKMRELHRASFTLGKFMKDQVNLIQVVTDNQEFINATGDTKKEIAVQSLKVSSGVKEIKFFDSKGELVFDAFTSDEDSGSPASYFDDRWKEQALSGKISKSKVFFQNGEPWINISVPVENSNDKEKSGVLSVYISLETAFAGIGEIIQKGDGFTYIVDDKGTVIFVSGALQNLFPSVTPGTRLDNTQISGYYFDTINNEPFLISSFRIENSGWQMISRTKVSELSFTTQRLLYNLAGAMVLALLFAFLLSAYMARRITQPLEEITDITKQMAKGDYNREIPVKKTSDEINTFAESFEEMRQKLKKYVEENKDLYSKTKARLEKRVLELRTIHSVTEAFASISNKDELLNYIVEQVQGVLNAKFCNIYILDDSGVAKIRASKCVVSLDPKKYAIPEFPLDAEPYTEVKDSLKALIVHEVESEDWLKDRLQTDEIGAYCLFPLFKGEKLFGLIELGLKHGEDLVEGSIRLLTTVAKEASIAIENARLYRTMEEEKKRVEAIISTISDGVMTMDDEGIITSFNQSAELITGYKAHKVVGKPCSRIFMGLQKDEGSDSQVFCSKKGCLLKAAQDLGQYPYQSEHMVVTPTHERKILEFTTTIEQQQPNSKKSFVSVFRDVSKIKELERLRSDFIDTMSHELRTPLTSVKGYVATLMHPKASFSKEEMKDFLKIISDETDHLNRMINDLLEASKLNSNTLVVKMQPYDLGKIIKTQVEKYKPTSNKHEFKVGIDYHSSIYGDPVQMEFVLTHLIENAIKYSPDGGDIKISIISEEESLVKVILEDQGLGIPLDQREKVFDLFHRVDNRSTRRIYGPGLGLFISKKVIEAHGGKIWVEPGEEGGSRFVFTLPQPSFELSIDNPDDEENEG
ncbi:MAG: ATP-binding protein [Firmicutes bacterium]|nr:ATP-binding protein [Bacillota bacterium]